MTTHRENAKRPRAPWEESADIAERVEGVIFTFDKVFGE